MRVCNTKIYLYIEGVITYVCIFGNIHVDNYKYLKLQHLIQEEKKYCIQSMDAPKCFHHKVQ